MKKVTILLSVMLLAALVLSACGANNNGNNFNETPGVGVTTPGAGVVDNTPVVVDTPPLVDATPTTAVVVESTPTVAATLLTDDATPVVGATGTPVAGVPVTGAEVCATYTLEHLLAYDVVDSAGNKIGEVEGAIVLRDAAAAVVVDDDDDALAVAPAFGQNTQPVIAFLVVEMDDDFFDGDVNVVQTTPVAGDNAVLTTTPVAGDTTGMTTTTDANVADDDDEFLIPFTAFEGLVVTEDGVRVVANADDVDDCYLALSLGSDVLVNAPRVDLDEIDLDAEDWDADLFEFWSGNNVTVPQTTDTGAELGAAVWIKDTFTNIDALNYQGEDLGEASDFIFDPATGNLTYAVLNIGGFLGIGERSVLVPTTHVQWVRDDEDNDLGDPGRLLIDMADDAWDNVPVFGDLDEVDMTLDTWDDEIETYWNGLTAPVRETTPVQTTP